MISDMTQYLPFSVWLILLSIIPTLVVQVVRSLPTVQETRVLPLGREGPLGKEMATYSSILAWRTPWTEGYCPWGCKVLDMTEQLSLHFTHLLKAWSVASPPHLESAIRARNLPRHKVCSSNIFLPFIYFCKTHFKQYLNRGEYNMEKNHIYILENLIGKWKF